jgi:DedD protein
MEEGAKRRLVGAAFLVVLAVIFLPMLLEEKTPPPIPEEDMSIPPRPDFDRAYDASRGEGSSESFLSSPTASGQPTPESFPPPRELPPTTFFEAPATAEPDYKPEIETGPESEPAVEPEQPASALVEKTPSPAKPAPEPKPLSTSRTTPTRPPVQKSTGSRSWVIQVASLRDRARAYALVQDLRAKGFPAYMEEAEVKQKLWHRVRIGPEAEHKQIESMAASLQAKTGMKGQIQRYP